MDEEDNVAIMKDEALGSADKELEQYDIFEGEALT